MTTLQESGSKIELGKRSEGFKWYLSFLLDFNANFGSEIKNCVILLDEPGIHLHPGAQRTLLMQLEELSKSNQIIYTTHQPFMINKMFPKRIIYLNKNNGITILEEPRKEGIFDDLLLSATLGFEFTSMSNWGEINVFVEGITDKILIEKIILEKANQKKEIILDLNQFSIIPINGVNNLENFIRVSQEINAKYVVLLDNDESTQNSMKKYQKRPKNHPETIDHIILLDDNTTMEDYIPHHILRDALMNLLSSPYYQDLNSLFKNFKFEEDLIAPQLKVIVGRINNTQLKPNENDNGENERDKIENGAFKIELLLKVKDLINSDNIDEFQELIQKIQEIKEVSIKLFNK